MTSNHQEVNQFLVQVFNEILKTEELCISNSKFTNLSLREIHIIETVCLANDKGEDNSSMAIAQALQITPGTLQQLSPFWNEKDISVAKRISTINVLYELQRPISDSLPRNATLPFTKKW